jgi:hypothetical protein
LTMFQLWLCCYLLLCILLAYLDTRVWYDITVFLLLMASSRHFWKCTCWFSQYALEQLIF